jgi:hypothetical protein
MMTFGKGTLQQIQCSLSRKQKGFADSGRVEKDKGYMQT